MSRGWKTLLLVLLLLVVLTGRSVVPSTAQTEGTPAAESVVDWRFGVIESQQAPGHARNLGVAWTRVRFQWAEVQAGGPGTWTPDVTNEELSEQQAAGRLIVGLLIGIPDWARGADRLPDGLYLPIDDPGNRWAFFVREAVARYAGQIDHWVIWNEPDIWDADALGHTWDGDEADFAQLLRVAYLTARDVNPNVVIHLPAFTYFWDANYGREQYIGRLFDALLADPDAAANNYYFDVLTAHLYFNPDLIYTTMRLFDEIRSERGLPHKPIWLMETNAPPIDDPLWPVEDWTLSVTELEQAYFMPQMTAAALAAGAERIGVYKLKDIDSDRGANPEPFGLIRSDGTRRLAFNSYRTTMEFLAAAEDAEVERWDAVGQVRIDQPDRTTTVVFSRLPAPQVAEVTAIAATGFLVDPFNARRVFLDAVDGVFRIELPPALCSQSIGDYCMIGGETFFLVQARDGGPAPVVPPAGAPVPPRPTPSATPPPTVTGSPAAIANAAETRARATASPTQAPATEETAAPPAPATATGAPAGLTPAPARQTATPGADEESATPLPPPSANTIDFSVWIAAGIALVASALLVAGIFRRLLN